MNNRIALGLVTALGVLAMPPVLAGERAGEDRHSMTLTNVNVRPATLAQARQTLSRIEGAALVLCGAPRGTSSILKRAVMKTPCFRDAVAEAVRTIDHPLITRLHQSAR